MSKIIEEYKSLKQAREQSARENNNNGHDKDQSGKTDDFSTLQTLVLLAQKNKELPIDDIIQDLGLSEAKSDILKTIDGEVKNYNKVIDKSFDSNTLSYRKYGNVLNILADVQGEIGSANKIDNFEHLVKDILRASKENNQTAYSGFTVATDDGGGGNDPEYTKLSVYPAPFRRSGHDDNFERYLIRLESNASKEIHSRSVVKEDVCVDFTKKIKPSLDKLSWRERCDEV